MIRTLVSAAWQDSSIRWSVLAPVIMIGFTAATLVLLRIHRFRDAVAYYGMSQECHPIWRELAIRRYDDGDPVANMLSEFPPTRSEVFAHYGRYSYEPGGMGGSFTGLCIVAKDGKLVSATTGSCTWQFTFFNSLGDDEDIDQKYKAYAKARTEEGRKRRLMRLGYETN